SCMPRSRLCMALEGTPPGCDQLALLTAAGMAIGSLAASLGAAAALSSGELLSSTVSRVPGRISSFLPVNGSRSLSAAPVHPARTVRTRNRTPAILIITPSRLCLDQRLEHRRHDLGSLPQAPGGGRARP